MKAAISNGGGLGNVLHSIPLARAMCELLKSPPDLVCNRNWHGVFDDQPMFGTMRSGIKAGEYDAVIQCHLTGSTLSFKDAKDGQNKTAMKGKRISQFSRHETEAGMEAARMLGWDKPTPSYLLEDPVFFSDRLLPIPFIGVATRSAEVRGWERKNWPDEHWQEFSACLPAVPVFFGPKTSSRPWMDEYGIDLCGKTTIKEARDAIWQAAAFVGPDCGLSHLAACCGIPSVVLFGPTSVVKNRPSGDRVRVITLDMPCIPCQPSAKAWAACHDHRCMTGITPKSVLAAVDGILG